MGDARYAPQAGDIVASSPASGAPTDAATNGTVFFTLRPGFYGPSISVHLLVIGTNGHLPFIELTEAERTAEGAVACVEGLFLELNLAARAWGFY